MSTLEAISIQGIRSFDPQKPQLLNFLRPVTLILGPNGTGKTTIIECLKYATTGDLPPGSKVGGSFVHDPKMANETEVKAKVSLEIKNIKGEPVTVSRSLKATQKDKNKQVSMQTIDSSIKKMDSAGKIISISSKCADIDLEMSTNLGVSKAVLESVIFCHQEDSNWPLTEGKAVKERFDDLFASARYVKALESIRKIKLEKEENVKTCKSDLKYLKDYLDERNEKLAEQSKLEYEQDCFMRKICDFKEKLGPIEKSINEYQSKYTELCDIKKQRDVFQNEKESTEIRIEELRTNISQEYNSESTELQFQIDNYEKALSVLNSSILEEQYKQSGLEIEISNWQKDNQTLLQKKGALGSKIHANYNLEREARDNLKDMITEINEIWDENNHTSMIKKLQNYVSDLETRHETKKKEFDSEINMYRTNMQSILSEKTKHEHEIEINKSNQTKKNEELINLKRKHSAMEQESRKLNSISELLNDLNSDLKKIQSSFNVENAQANLKTLSGNISALEDRISKIDCQIVKCQRDESVYKDINSKKDQKSEKMSFSKCIRNRHNDKLEILFSNDIPDNNLKRLIDQKLCEMRTKNIESQASQMNLQSKLTALEMEIKQNRDKIADNQELVQTFDDNLYEICGNFQLDTSLSEFKEKKRKLEEEQLSTQSSVLLYSRFREMLLKNKSDCPLCHREFMHESEINDLIDEINEKCAKVPTKVENLSQELSVINGKIESLIKLESQWEKIRNLKEFVINDLQNQFQSKKLNITEIQRQMAKLSKERDDYNSNEEIASTILGDVANMEKYNDEVINIDKQISILEQEVTVTENEFNKTFQTIKDEKATLLIDLNATKKYLEESRILLDDTLKEQHELTAKINNLESEKLKIQKLIHDFSNYQFQQENLNKEMETLEKQIQSSLEKLNPINIELVSIKKTCDELVVSEKKYVSNINMQINLFKSRVDNVKKLFLDVNKNQLENLSEQLKKIEIKISELNSKIKINNNDLELSKSKVEDAKTKIGNQKIQKREIQDTLLIRQYKSKIDDLNHSIRNSEGKLGGFDFANIQTEAKHWEDQRRLLKNEIDKSEFRKNQIDTQIEFFSKELRSDRLDNANSKYLEKLYEVKTTELAITDLEKYYKALDKAIMSYHHSKMIEINKILKELWQNTYYGKDIEYLEICSDEDLGSGAAKKRNYNYRVVMVKSNGGARLDMRGRCSAGQKVLACLLIRLALAEVFCLHCGVIALDEPTTNLDEENMTSLANALIEIIKRRSKRKEFQLIIITHDEDFVQLLGHSEYLNDFYRISSNSRSHSEIRMNSIDRRA